MTIDTKRPVSVKLAPCEERKRRWLEIEQNLCDAALRMGKEPHLGEGWYRRIVKPELTLLADEIDRLRRERDEALAKAEAWANSDFALGLVVEHLRQENGGLTPSWLLDMSEEWNDKRVPELEDEA